MFKKPYPVAGSPKKMSKQSLEEEDGCKDSDADLLNNAGSNTGNETMGPPSKKYTRKTVQRGTSDVLRGVVALVSVGSESRALALRAALSALGASVVPSWSPLVTHLVWTEGGSRTTRARARSLATQLVSPLWVEACAAAECRLSERTFPATPRPSDLPSPRTLRLMLNRIGKDDIMSLPDANKDADGTKRPRLRTSSETSQNTTEDTVDKSTDKSADTSANTSRESTDVASRVNTAPRRALPMSMTPPQAPRRSRRRLFTQKDPYDESSTDSEEEDEAPQSSQRGRSQLRPRERSGLSRAERMARKLVQSFVPTSRPARIPPFVTGDDTDHPKIVLTGMCRMERARVRLSCRALAARLQRRVSRRTTHVLVGSFRRSGAASDTGSRSGLPSSGDNVRTLNCLIGAARGCRVLTAQWALDSFDEGRWLPYQSYEVPQLKHLAQKAYIEKRAFGLTRSDYAYDVFNSKRIKLSDTAYRRSEALTLLGLCGAVVFDRNNEVIQNVELYNQSERPKTEIDINIGCDPGEISSLWVFDSVASARMRNTRKYVNPG